MCSPKSNLAKVNHLTLEYFLKGKISIEIHVSCLYLHKLSKIYFTVLTCSPTGLSSLPGSSTFLKNEISHITRENKQLKFLEISIRGYLPLTQQRKRKRKLTFSDNAKSARLASGLNAERQPVPRQS